jgi:hypothetical protein
MARQLPSPRALLDDRAVAGVVGFVLILAVAISYYAYVAKSDVPRWGQENENNWNQLVESSMNQLAREAGSGVATGATVAGLVPQPPQPHSFDVPLLGRTQPVAPGGSVTFQQDSAYWWLNATGCDVACPSLQWSNNGSIDFKAETVYTQPFGYHLEYGGLVKEGSSSSPGLVVVGPSISERVLQDPAGTTNLSYQVAITLVDLRGSGGSSIGGADVPIDLESTSGSTVSTLVQTSDPGGVVTLNMTTHYGQAWKTWFSQTLGSAGFNSTRFNVTDTAETPACPGVCVTLESPPTANAQLAPPLSVAVTQGLYDAKVR